MPELKLLSENINFLHSNKANPRHGYPELKSCLDNVLSDYTSESFQDFFKAHEREQKRLKRLGLHGTEAEQQMLLFFNVISELSKHAISEQSLPLDDLLISIDIEKISNQKVKACIHHLQRSLVATQILLFRTHLPKREIGNLLAFVDSHFDELNAPVQMAAMVAYLLECGYSDDQIIQLKLLEKYFVANVGCNTVEKTYAILPNTPTVSRFREKLDKTCVSKSVSRQLHYGDKAITLSGKHISQGSRSAVTRSDELRYKFTYLKDDAFRRIEKLFGPSWVLRLLLLQNNIPSFQGYIRGLRLDELNELFKFAERHVSNKLDDDGDSPRKQLQAKLIKIIDAEKAKALTEQPDVPIWQSLARSPSNSIENMDIRIASLLETPLNLSPTDIALVLAVAAKHELRVSHKDTLISEALKAFLALDDVTASNVVDDVSETIEEYEYGLKFDVIEWVTQFASKALKALDADAQNCFSCSHNQGNVNTLFNIRDRITSQYGQYRRLLRLHPELDTYLPMDHHERDAYILRLIFLHSPDTYQTEAKVWLAAMHSPDDYKDSQGDSKALAEEARAYVVYQCIVGRTHFDLKHPLLMKRHLIGLVDGSALQAVMTRRLNESNPKFFKHLEILHDWVLQLDPSVATHPSEIILCRIVKVALQHLASTGARLSWMLRLLAPRIRCTVFKIVFSRDCSLSLIQDREQLALVLRYLEDDQCQQVLDVVKNRLLTSISNIDKLTELLLLLDPAQCSKVLAAIEGQLRTAINNSQQLGNLLLKLTDERKVAVIERLAKLGILNSLITNHGQLIEVLNPTELSSPGPDTDSLLEISEALVNSVLPAVDHRLLDLILDVDQLVAVLEATGTEPQLHVRILSAVHACDPSFGFINNLNQFDAVCRFVPSPLTLYWISDDTRTKIRSLSEGLRAKLPKLITDVDQLFDALKCPLINGFLLDKYKTCLLEQVDVALIAGAVVSDRANDIYNLVKSLLPTHRQMALSVIEVKPSAITDCGDLQNDSDFVLGAIRYSRPQVLPYIDEALLKQHPALWYASQGAVADFLYTHRNLILASSSVLLIGFGILLPFVGIIAALEITAAATIVSGVGFFSHKRCYGAASEQDPAVGQVPSM